MRADLLKILRCPRCRGDLELSALEARDNLVAEGVLACRREECASWYPVTEGIPRMVPPDLRPTATKRFFAAHGGRLDRQRLASVQELRATPDPIRELKSRTLDNFGFEWREYRRFGWDDPVHDLERERGVFAYKSLLEPGDLARRWVLDAGCGNGRYSWWAAQYGGEVVGIDLTEGSVESAYDNTQGNKSIHIVQADIFRLPFAERAFDVIFSIGVLMHTGDARRAFLALARQLGEGGSITVHLYGKGNYLYEALDAAIRRRTATWSPPTLMRMTRILWAIAQPLHRIGLLNHVRRFVRLDPHPHCIFDWYAAPIATHHTYAEVLGWFKEAGLEVRGTNQRPQHNPFKRALKPWFGGPEGVTVRGWLGSQRTSTSALGFT